MRVFLLLFFLVASTWSFCEKFLTDEEYKGPRRCRADYALDIDRICGEVRYFHDGADRDLLSSCCCSVGCSDQIIQKNICPMQNV
uniref:Insulin-like domain-containing protein n=1 Tax=Caenorhabditis japonica TaxID=281687 RepID=A0A8R1DRL0_CAEJA